VRVAADMSFPDQFDVEKIIAIIPVEVTEERLSDVEFYSRVAQICKLFDIEATGEENGIRYGPRGLWPADDPLAHAILALMERRFRA
jgi:hypothetical protein